MARSRKKPPVRRPHKLTVMLSAEELATLGRVAAKRGFNASVWVREAIRTADEAS